MANISYRPIIIIGAPRSGTNMLREVLASLPGAGTWPCDEINPIWRHGNLCYPYDDFGPEMATPKVRRFIRGKFHRLACRRNVTHVIEKTCANSLRVAFVEKIWPEAFYVYIVRDGVDAVASAMKRWHAGLDLGYAFRKARYIPVADWPHYAFTQFGNRLHRLFAAEKRLAYWGPRTREVEQAAAGGSLAEACAVQWRQCVEFAEEDLAKLPPSRVCRIRYEDFVQKPEREMYRICQAAGIPLLPEGLFPLVGNVSASSVGRGDVELSEKTAETVRVQIQTVLDRYGYR